MIPNIILKDKKVFINIFIKSDILRSKVLQDVSQMLASGNVVSRSQLKAPGHMGTTVARGSKVFPCFPVFLVV